MWYNKGKSFFLASPVISKVIVSNTTNFPIMSQKKRIHVKSGMLKYFWVKRRKFKENGTVKRRHVTRI